MKKLTNTQSGFTAVELLITLFVAAAFLIAGYQLFNVVIKDGGQARAESRAANIAYDYMRRYSVNATDPCTPLTPLNSSSISVDGLTNTKITIAITCPNASTPKLSEIEATITYNSPTQTVRYATYTTGTATPGANDVTDGMVAWWKLNGNGNTDVGSNSLTFTGGALTNGQNAQPNGAYAFNGTNSQYASTTSTLGLGSTDVTVSLWVNSVNASATGAFIKIGGTTGYGIGMGTASSTFDNTSAAGTKIVMLFEGVRWIATTVDLGTGWHHVVMTIDGTGLPSLYRDGTFSGSFSGTSASTPTGNASYLGAGGSTSQTARYFNGSIDDVRIFNRALSAAEISTLYSNGAK